MPGEPALEVLLLGFEPGAAAGWDAVAFACVASRVGSRRPRWHSAAGWLHMCPGRREAWGNLLGVAIGPLGSAAVFSLFSLFSLSPFPFPYPFALAFPFPILLLLLSLFLPTIQMFRANESAACQLVGVEGSGSCCQQSRLTWPQDLSRGLVDQEGFLLLLRLLG